MSYNKAMRHHANLLKCKKQGNNYFGFDTGSGRWPSIWSTEYGSAYMSLRLWFKDRHFEPKEKRQYLRECIREQIAIMRKYKPKALCIFSASKTDLFGGGFMQINGRWGDKKDCVTFEPKTRWIGMPDDLPADAVWVLY